MVIEFILAVTFIGAHVQQAISAFTTDPVVIEMTSRGFAPGYVEITQGQTVLFKNVDVFEHWPASSIHPTHTLYPGSDIRNCGTVTVAFMFDPCRGIAPGETFAFTFHHAGTWSFHDHLFPRYGGKVVVAERSGYRVPFGHTVAAAAANVLATVTQSLWAADVRIPGLNQARVSSTADPDAIKRLLDRDTIEARDVLALALDDVAAREIVSRLGVRDAMRKLIEASEGGASYECHLEAHYLGRAGYDVYQERVFEECTTDCHSGCYHGALESLFQKEGSGLIERAIAICTSRDTPFKVAQCFHGIGHGLLAFTHYDVPETLRLCQSLGSDEAKNSCYGGVFMENVQAGLGLGFADEGHVSEWVKWDDLHYPCNILTDDPDAQARCYEMQTSWMLIVESYDYKKVAAACSEADPAMVPICFQSLGRDIGSATLRNTTRIQELCTLVPDAYHGSCITGALNIIIDFWGSALGDQASSFCATVEPAASRRACFERLAERMNDIFLTHEERRAQCASFPESYTYLCTP